MADPPFPADTMKFLSQIAKNNNKPWFEKNKPRYEAIKAAGLEFVEEAGLVLRPISTTLVADPKPIGGSLMRIHRDVRFSKDKSPYKTGLGIHFRHRDADAEAGHSAPGFFLHIEPGESILCSGMWHPDPKALQAIREAMVADPKGWTKAKAKWELTGESLARAPKGFDAEHPLVADLKRKDFVACANLTDKQVLAQTFLKEFAATAKAMAPFNAWLADATGNDW